jgi:hypothetical protein
LRPAAAPSSEKKGIKKPGWPAGTDQVIPARKNAISLYQKEGEITADIQIIKKSDNTMTIRVRQDDQIIEITDVPIEALAQ